MARLELIVSSSAARSHTVPSHGSHDVRYSAIDSESLNKNSGAVKFATALC